jgi:hypothetical protein
MASRSGKRTLTSMHSKLTRSIALLGEAAELIPKSSLMQRENMRRIGRAIVQAHRVQQAIYKFHPELEPPEFRLRE